MQGQQGDVSLGLKAVGSLWEKWTWRGDCRDELGSSSPPWVLAGSMRSSEVVAYEQDAVSYPYEFQEDWKCPASSTRVSLQPQTKISLG